MHVDTNRSHPRLCSQSQDRWRPGSLPADAAGCRAWPRCAPPSCARHGPTRRPISVRISASSHPRACVWWSGLTVAPRSDQLTCIARAARSAQTIRPADPPQTACSSGQCSCRYSRAWRESGSKSVPGPTTGSGEHAEPNPLDHSCCPLAAAVRCARACSVSSCPL
jgi:hypothetical protein